MKYLLILLILFPLRSYSACDMSTEQTISECTLEDFGLEHGMTQEELDEWKDKNIKKLRKKNRVRNVKNFRMVMRKCNVNRANMAILKKEIISDPDETLLKCLESKNEEVRLEMTLKKAEEIKQESAKEYLKEYNCNRLSNKFQKNLCIYMKGRM